MDREAYLRQTNGDPYMLLPDATVDLLFRLARIWHPTLLIEHGAGWSTIRLAELGIKHICIEHDARWRARVSQFAAPAWYTSATFAHCAENVLSNQRILSLVDGDESGRTWVTAVLADYADSAIIVFDDANADYVQRPARALAAVGEGRLYDAQKLTSAQRRQETWAWVWVGNKIKRTSQLQGILASCASLP